MKFVIVDFELLFLPCAEKRQNILCAQPPHLGHMMHWSGYQVVAFSNESVKTTVSLED